MPSVSIRRRIVQEDGGELEEEIRPTQSRHKGQRRAPPSEGEEEDDDDHNQEDEDGEDGEEMDTDGAEPDVQHQTVKKLVRYALACEYQRIRITRAGITEKAIGKQRGAAFKHIFESAQRDLRMKFGMEMVPLPGNDKVTVKQKRAAAKTGGNARSTTTANYILTSIIDPDYKRASIMPPSMISSQREEAQYMAVCTIIVSLVSLSQGGLPDAKLIQYLRRLNLETNTPVGNLKDTLARMRKDGYLNRVVEQTAEDETTEWHVGPRGKVEISTQTVRGFVHEIYGERAPEDLDKRLQRSLGMEVKKSTSRNEEAIAAASGDPGPSTQGGRSRRRAPSNTEDDDDDD